MCDRRRLEGRVVAGFLLSVLCATAVAAANLGPNPPCVSQTFETTPFTVCTFDARTQEIGLALNDRRGTPLRSFRRLQAFLGPDARRVRFAMNAGMFDAHGEPIGLYSEHGKEIRAPNTSDGAGNFYMKPNGVFSADTGGALHIDVLFGYLLRQSATSWATQSGPMLVVDGALHPLIQQNGASAYVRNGVGVRDSHTAIFAISDAPVSFGRLARFFRDRLGCRNALYFDGAVSSLWEPATGRRDEKAALGPMVVVMDKL